MQPSTDRFLLRVRIDDGFGSWSERLDPFLVELLNTDEVIACSLVDLD